MDWMLMPLRRYADFSGRSRRKEYWMFALFYVLIGAALAVLGGIMGAFTDTTSDQIDGGGMGLIVVLLVGAVFLIALIIPSLAVTVRRFHDQDRSGWMVLLNFIPYVGGIIVFVFMLLPGTPGPNRFGPDPKVDELSGVGRPAY